MRNSAFLIATVICSTLACAAHAQLGGRLGGALGGGLGGSLSGLSGSVNGSLNGRLTADADLSPAEQAAAQARAEARRAREDARRQARVAAHDAPSISGAASVVVGGSAPMAAVQSTLQGRGSVASAGVGVVTAAPPRVQIAPPIVGLAPREVTVVRERQSAALVGGGVEVLSVPESYVYMDRQAEELRRELSGTGVLVERQGDTIALEMPGDVTFAFNKWDIRPRFYSVLDRVAATLNRYPATYVDVIGHTDAIGSADYNQWLSERRAGSVADYIQEREEIPARLYVAGRGKSEPTASNATVEGRAANRRVEILLHPYVRG
jgi:outer membrane protein OmpA-like peptidoglycan-associated protein